MIMSCVSTLRLTVCVLFLSTILSIAAPSPTVHAESNPQSIIQNGQIATPVSATPELTHPDTLTIHLDRSSGNNMKGAAKAASGSKAYQHLLRAQSHGARVNAERAKKELHTMSSTSTAPLTGCPFSDLTVPITIGFNTNTNRTYQLILDTGSATLAVAGSACSNCAGVTPKWTSSSSSSDDHLTASGLYGDGTGWSGEIWSDRVAIGGGVDGTNVSAYATTKLVVITQQSTSGYDSTGQSDSSAHAFFITDPCADASPSERSQIPFQGIVGLGFQALAQQTNTDSFIGNFFAQNPSVPSQFALQLCEYSGQLWLGGSDQSTYVGTPLYTPIINTAYWEVAPSDAWVGGVSLGFTPSNWTNSLSNAHIIDSGTSLLELPMPIYNAIVAEIIANPSFQKYFRVDASDNFFQQPSAYCEYPLTVTNWQELQQLLPTLTITFTNGLQLTMDGVGSYLLPCTNAYDQFTPGIAGVDGSGMIGGWSLMNQFVTFHDMANGQIGFAPSRGCTTGQIPLRANVTMNVTASSSSSSSTGPSGGASSSPSSDHPSSSTGGVPAGGDNPSSSTGSGGIDPSSSSTGAASGAVYSSASGAPAGGDNPSSSTGLNSSTAAAITSHVMSVLVYSGLVLSVMHGLL